MELIDQVKKLEFETKPEIVAEMVSVLEEGPITYIEESELRRLDDWLYEHEALPPELSFRTTGTAMNIVHNIARNIGDSVEHRTVAGSIASRLNSLKARGDKFRPAHFIALADGAYTALTENLSSDIGSEQDVDFHIDPLQAVNDANFTFAVDRLLYLVFTDEVVRRYNFDYSKYEIAGNIARRFAEISADDPQFNNRIIRMGDVAIRFYDLDTESLNKLVSEEPESRMYTPAAVLFRNHPPRHSKHPIR